MRTSYRHFLKSLALFAVLAACANAGAESRPASFYAREIDGLRQRLSLDPEARRQTELILEGARAILDKPIIRRFPTLETTRNPGAFRTGSIDPRTWEIRKIDPLKAELFALSEVDKSACHMLEHELPLLAAAVRLTGEPALLARVIDQLNEFVTWDPLQRPGWSLHNGTNELPPDGNDGVWLATGIGLVTLYQTIDLLPDDAVPPALHAAIDALFEREIKRSLDDWTRKPAWFMKGNAAISNQWVTPSSGLVIAAIATDRQKYSQAYELGIANLQRTLTGLGTEGASSEGAGYGMGMTAPYLYIAACAAQEVGDNRLASHPFLKNFPTWLSTSFQPGKNIINAFDGWLMTRDNYISLGSSITRLGVLSRDPHLSWVIKHEIGSPSRDLYGLLSLSASDSLAKEPPLHASYDRARWVAWRSSWSPNASGVWIRGGHPLDMHDHYDRGHVNFIISGKPLLIEAGTPGYAHKLKGERYDSVIGHNVLQAGGEIFPKRSPAPVSISRLDGTGGDVTVDAGAGYANVKQWKRHIAWDSHTMTVTDNVSLSKADVILFRWHLASRQPLTLQQAINGQPATAILPAGKIEFPGWFGKKPMGYEHWTPPEKEFIQTPAATITIKSDTPISLVQEQGFDHTLKFRVQDNPHILLVVRSANPEQRIKIKTTIASPEK